MRPHPTFLISGSSSEGGGLFSLCKGEVARIDSITTMGLCLAGDRFARLLKSPDATDTVTELLVYDSRGVERYYRFDGMGDPHDILWTGTHYVIVSSIENRISWISLDGTVQKVWEAPGEADSWHLNCLYMHDGRLYVSNFGKFATHRGWAEEKSGRSGSIVRLDDGVEVVSGLTQPHTPRFVDGRWVVCNSAAQELLAINPTSGAIERRLKLEGYTRGIAVLPDSLVVGESTGRYAASDRRVSSVCGIHRASWEVLWRIDIPTLEIYDILHVDESLAIGAQNGFRTTRFRLLEQDQQTLFEKVGVTPIRLWATGDPLPPDGFNISVNAIVPSTMQPGERSHIPFRVKNHAGAILVTAPPNPVYICYRWFSVADGEPIGAGEWIHTPLPRSLPPGEWLEGVALVAAPESPGEFRLSLTLLQENVTWFDDVLPSNSSQHLVKIVKPATDRSATLELKPAKYAASRISSGR